MNFRPDLRQFLRRPHVGGSLTALLAAAVLHVAPTPALAQQGADPAGASTREVNDASITRAIQSRMHRAGGVDASRVRVSTEGGVVTLSGTVPVLSARDVAQSVAQGVRGVTSVENRIKVQPPERTDEQILADVRAALASNVATGGAAEDVQVRVNDGVVTLSGSPGSWQMGRLMTQTIDDVRGVREIRSEFESKDAAERTDNEIATQVMRRIKDDAGLRYTELKVEVRQGKVTLSGNLSSAAGRERAIRSAWVPGVRSVEASGLEVSYRDRDRSAREARPAEERTNDEILAAVRGELKSEAWLRGETIQAAVDDHTVTLSGDVGSLAAKRAAERDTRDVAGVWKVVNNLRVRPDDRRTDEQTVHAIASAMERDAYLSDDKITITVDDGKATLKGDVDSAYERGHAVEIAQATAGVSDVDDNLTVNGKESNDFDFSLPAFYHPYWSAESTWGRDRADETRTDAEIKEDIEDQLFWSPFVDSDDLRVTVRGGVATLDGTVDDYSEHGAAIENAYEGGARQVKDNLTVLEGPRAVHP